MLDITVAQPNYYCGENPNLKIAEFLTEQMKLAREGSLLVLPEFSNAGGLSNPNDMLNELPKAKEILNTASKYAKENSAYIVINVFEERDGDLKNSTYLFDKKGDVAFIYDKIHLPPAEVDLGIKYGDGSCFCELDGIRFAFMTCYDVYYNEQIEYIASLKPDIILIPGYQRGERTDIIRAQAKLTAFRCNAFIARSSYSMGDSEHGGCSMIVAPDGVILKDMESDVGAVSQTVDEKQKYMRSAGFGGNQIPNDEFINRGLRPQIFKKS